MDINSLWRRRMEKQMTIFLVKIRVFYHILDIEKSQIVSKIKYFRFAIVVSKLSIIDTSVKELAPISKNKKSRSSSPIKS